MSGSSTYEIPFTVGSRRLLTVKRDVTTLAFSLEDILCGRIPPVPHLAQAEGLRVLSAPTCTEAQLRETLPGFLVGAREGYARSYIEMEGSYEDYLARFSGKTRSTLRRKRRKFEKAGGDELNLRSFCSSEELDEFLRFALPLSRKTYQARLLDAGLPESATARTEMRGLAEQGRVRAFLLFLGREAVAYLYLPVVGGTLVYAYLGYDPDHASLSPGTVLQMAALESLFAEGRFRYFDFTEGQGAHKALFGTDSVVCASFLMLPPTLANRTLLASHGGFNAAVGTAKSLARRSGLETAARRLLR